MNAAAPGAAMASIRERKTAGGKTRWHVQVRLQHTSATRSFERKADAKEWAEHTERLIKTGKFRLVNEARARRFSELCTRYKQDYMRPSRAKDYTQVLSWWEDRLGRLALEDVSAERIQKCLDELLASPKTARKRSRVPKRAATSYPTPVHAAFLLHEAQASNRSRPATAPTSSAPKTSAGTALRYLAVLSRMFTVSVRKLRWLEASPTDGVERPTGGPVKVPRVLTTAEESELLAQADASANRALQHIVRIGLRTGMRMMEIMRLRWCDIELQEGYGFILVQKAKNNRQRRVPLVGDALEAVLRLKTPLSEADLQSRLLFPSGKDKNQPVLIRAAWEKCLADARISNFRFHDLRHTFASRLAGQNYSLPRIAAVLGHVDLRSTQIYTHFAQDDAVAMVAATTVAATEALARLKNK